MVKPLQEYFFVVMRHAQPNEERMALAPQADEQIDNTITALHNFLGSLHSQSGKIYELGVAYNSKDTIPQLTAQELALRLGVFPAVNWTHLPADLSYLALCLKELTPTKIVVFVSHQPDVENWLRLAKAPRQFDASRSLLYAAPHFLRMTIQGNRIVEFRGVD